MSAPLGHQWEHAPSKYGDPTLFDPTSEGRESGRRQMEQTYNERERGGWGNPAHVQHYMDSRADPPSGYYKTGEPGTAQGALPGMEMTPQQHVDTLVNHLNTRYHAQQRGEGYEDTYPMVQKGRFANTGRSAAIGLLMEHHPESPYHSDQWDSGDPEEDHWHHQSYGPRQEPPEAVLDWQGYDAQQPEWAHSSTKPHLQGEIKEASIGGLHNEGDEGADAWKGHGVMSAMFTTAKRIAAEHPGVPEPRHSPTRTEEGTEWSQSQMRKHGEEVW
jgi:hypothetical protein